MESIWNLREDDAMASRQPDGMAAYLDRTDAASPQRETRFVQKHLRSLIAP